MEETIDEELLSDDLMPNDASMFESEADPELVQSINTEKAMVQAAAPMFEHIFGWFDEAIAQTDSIDQLKAGGAIPIESQLVAAQVLKKELVSMRGRLSIMRDNYLKQD